MNGEGEAVRMRLMVVLLAAMLGRDVDQQFVYM